MIAPPPPTPHFLRCVLFVLVFLLNFVKNDVLATALEKLMSVLVVHSPPLVGEYRGRLGSGRAGGMSARLAASLSRTWVPADARALLRLRPRPSLRCVTTKGTPSRRENSTEQKMIFTTATKPESGRLESDTMGREEEHAGRAVRGRAMHRLQPVDP